MNFFKAARTKTCDFIKDKLKPMHNLHIECIDIPAPTTLTIFDDDNKESEILKYDLIVGKTIIDAKVPKKWKNPFYNIRTGIGYYIPDSRNLISDFNEILSFSGADYYRDVDGLINPEQLNAASVEELIHSVFATENLNARQKFYISIGALESYFEQLVYDMLVLSGYKTMQQFEHRSLDTQYKRTPVALDLTNTHFFCQTITLCPGKTHQINLPNQQIIDRLRNIFNVIRKIRNNVLHGWGYHDLSRQDLYNRFQTLGENLNIHGDDDIFYKNISFILLRLYAYTHNNIGNIAKYHREKYLIIEERASRGY